MTKEQYNYQKKHLEEEWRNKQRDLAKEYALSNNPHKIGDVITDHIKTIKIESIAFYNGGSSPECLYKGIQYNKSGSISKRQDDNKIYQSNIINSQQK